MSKPPSTPPDPPSLSADEIDAVMQLTAAYEALRAERSRRDAPKCTETFKHPSGREYRCTLGVDHVGLGLPHDFGPAFPYTVNLRHAEALLAEVDRLAARVAELERERGDWRDGVLPVDPREAERLDLLDYAGGLENTIKTLRGDVDNLLWNLGGVSSVCMGALDADFTFDASMARAALHDVVKLRREFLALRGAVTAAPYPLTIIPTRYGGVYEGGAWAAFACDPDRVPLAAIGSDVECCAFWLDEAEQVGVGATPAEAVASLVARRKS